MSDINLHNTFSLTMRYRLILLFSLFGLLNTQAQDIIHNDSITHKPRLVFDINNHNFFDNREVRSPYQRSQTLFGSQLGTEIGIEFGANTVMAGMQVIKDFGAQGLAVQDFTFYYHYEQDGFSGAFGAFPRKRLRRELPDIFLYDSLRYYSPTLHGALIQYANDRGYAELYCNWISKQGVDQREVFEIVSDGRFGHRGYYIGWNAQLLHYSVPRPSAGLKVYDKLMLNPHLGIERSHFGWFDTFSIEGGLMLSLNRDRRDMLWHAPMGFLGDLRLSKWRFELRNRLYAGNPQYTHYEDFGASLFRGDPYYRSSLYDRTDICFYLLNKPYVQCYVGASLHYTEGSLDNSQQIILRLTPDTNLLKDLF